MSDSAPPPPPESNDPVESTPPPPPPPPPPAASPPPAAPAAPPPAAPAASAAPSINTDELKSAIQGAHQFDLGQIGLGVLAFIASMLPYYTVSSDFFGESVSFSASAWHGFFGWFGAFAALAGAIALAASLFFGVVIPSLRTAVLGAFGVGAVCTVLALFVFPGGNYSGSGIDTGHGFGYWLALLCVLGGTALAVLRLQADD